MHRSQKHKKDSHVISSIFFSFGICMQKSCSWNVDKIDNWSFFMSIGTCPSYTLCVRWSREAVRDGSSSGSGFCRLQHRFQTLSSHNTCKMPDSGFAQTVSRWEDKLTVRKACQSCNFWKALGWRGKELALIKRVKLSLRNLVKSHLSKAGPSGPGKAWADSGAC